ncbi:MAG: DUF1697 domain-containing protein [Sporolactobacillus sp.]
MKRQFCAFLRGVNVNGRRMKMDDLAKLFESIGFSDVRTILATGNVLFTPLENQTEQELKEKIETELSEQFQYEASVFIRGEKKLRAIHAAAKTIPVSKDFHNYLILSDEKELLVDLDQLFHSITPQDSERFQIKAGEAFWIVPKGSTLSSEFGSKILGSKKYKSKLTSRNIRTIEKIDKLLNT